MTFKILINGKPLHKWLTASVTRSLDRNAGTFEFSSSNTTPASYPVKAGDRVIIAINETPVLTGYCDVLDYTVRDGEDVVTVAGRDNVQDLVDSSLPDSVKNIEGPISIPSLCVKVIASLGAKIGVTQTAQNIPILSDEEIFMADAGGNCIDYLTSFARKRQVHLIADGDGNLDVFRPTERLFPGAIVNREDGLDNNVIQASSRFDHSERYGIYQVNSQDNFGTDHKADYDAGVDRKGNVTDPKIRSSRYLEVQAEESFDDDVCEARAAEEANIRIARGLTYRATLPGVERDPGILWDIGQLTKVEDSFSGLSGIFVTRSVTFSSSAEEGTKTEVTLAPPGSYTARQPNEGDERLAKQGPEFQDEKQD